MRILPPLRALTPSAGPTYRRAMPRATRRHAVSSLFVASILSALPLLALADDNDLVLSRLGTATSDDVVGSSRDFRALASELGVILAPRLTEPADTLGFGGFHFVADVAFTSYDPRASYWRALESSSPDASSHGTGTMTTTGLFVRKGIWLPLPSFEVGLGAVHLGSSKMWSGQGYLKFALHEGYHDLPLPSVAVRGGAARMMGSEQMDLTVASFDVSGSKDFGVAGTFSVSPYAGWNWLLIIPRSEVIDKTPHIDAQAGMMDPMDARFNFVFADQDNIVRNRFFTGVKLKYYVFTLHFEGAFALRGQSEDDRPGTDLSCSDVAPDMPTLACDARDASSAQSSFNLGLGLDF